MTTTLLTSSPLVTEDLSLDFGFYEPLSLGDLVWLDTNNNGVYEPGLGEAGDRQRGGGAVPSGRRARSDDAGDDDDDERRGAVPVHSAGRGGYVVHIPTSEFGVGAPLVGLTSTVPTAVDPNTDTNEDVRRERYPERVGWRDVRRGDADGGYGALGDDVATIDSGTADDNSNLTVDFGFYRIAGVGIIKTVTPGIVVPNMPFTYTIRIDNTGPATVTTVTLTDTLPSGLSYVAGFGSPADPDVIAEPLLVWLDLGSLTPGSSMTVTFQVTAAAGITGTIVNTATMRGIHAGGSITETSSVPVTVVTPTLSVTKTLVAHDHDAGLVTFTISVTDPGISALDVVPLYKYCIDTTTWVLPRPVQCPRKPANDGRLDWYDLTGPHRTALAADLIAG